MTNVIFEIDKAIFSFDLHDAMDLLVWYSSENHVKEALPLLRFLEASLNKPRRVPSKKEFLGFNALKLFGKDKDSISYKTSQKTYQLGSLQSVPIGHGKNLFPENIKEMGGDSDIFIIPIIFKSLT